MFTISRMLHQIQNDYTQNTKIFHVKTTHTETIKPLVNPLVLYIYLISFLFSHNKKANQLIICIGWFCFCAFGIYWGRIRSTKIASENIVGFKLPRLYIAGFRVCRSLRFYGSSFCLLIGFENVRGCVNTDDFKISAYH